MLILVIYSFNASRLVTVWAGFSTKWYVELFQDQQLLDAAWMSLKIAFLTACMSLMMGMLASLALVRLGRFRGKMSFAGMITAPLVMPEVITLDFRCFCFLLRWKNLLAGLAEEECSPSGLPM